MTSPYSKRNAAIVERVRNGESCTNLAAELGISRERVRQIYRKHSGDVAPLRGRPDLVTFAKALWIIRNNRNVVGWRELDVAMGKRVTGSAGGRSEFWKTLRRLDMYDQVTRLFRLRRRQRTREQLLETVRTHYRTTGRVPLIRDGLVNLGTAYKLFDCWNDMLRAAGIPVIRARPTFTKPKRNRWGLCYRQRNVFPTANNA